MKCSPQSETPIACNDGGFMETAGIEPAQRSHQSGADADVAGAVLRTMRHRLGAAGVDELAAAAGLDPVDVLDALYDLERRGLVEPTVWRVVRDGEAST